VVLLLQLLWPVAYCLLPSFVAVRPFSQACTRLGKGFSDHGDRPIVDTGFPCDSAVIDVKQKVVQDQFMGTLRRAYQPVDMHMREARGQAGKICFQLALRS